MSQGFTDQLSDKVRPTVRRWRRRRKMLTLTLAAAAGAAAAYFLDPENGAERRAWAQARWGYPTATGGAGFAGATGREQWPADQNVDDIDLAQSAGAGFQARP